MAYSIGMLGMGIADTLKEWFGARQKAGVKIAFSPFFGWNAAIVMMLQMESGKRRMILGCAEKRLVQHFFKILPRMIITEKFVYIHRPKTGGSFVTDALLKMYDGKWSWLSHDKLAIFIEIHFTNRLGSLTINGNKHGGCNQISPKYHNRRIVSTIRIHLIIMVRNMSLAGGNVKAG